MSKQVVLLIIGMTMVSFIPRALPLILFNKKNLPPILVKWLSFIPAAVLAALLAPDLFIPMGSWDFSFTNLYLLAAIPTIGIALVSRSMIWTLLAGMGSFAFLQFFL